jgi:hypothetical protein
MDTTPAVRTRPQSRKQRKPEQTAALTRSEHCLGTDPTDGKYTVVKEGKRHGAMLRITSILLAVIVGLASSNVPAAAQPDLSKSWGDNWAKSCVTDIRQRIQRGGASIPFPLDGAADNCCRNERGKDSKAACNNLSSNDQAGRVNCQNALETCKNEVKTDPGINVDIAKAEEKEREKAAANCKGVAVKDLPAKICCTGSKGTGCVAELVDCERLGGSQVKSGAEPACNKVFPGYTGHVVAVPEIDCSLIKVDTAWTG